MKAFAYFAVLFMILLISCKGKTTKRNDYLDYSESRTLEKYVITDSITVELLKDEFFGRELHKVYKYNGFSIVDTIMDDEGVAWSGKLFIKNNLRYFLLENNWKDSIHITRITIFNRKIKTKDGISIGSKFKDIKNYVVARFGSDPDGYFSLYDKKQNNICYPMNTKKYRDIIDTLSYFNEIPEDLSVESIVIF